METALIKHMLVAAMLMNVLATQMKLVALVSNDTESMPTTQFLYILDFVYIFIIHADVEAF